MQKVLFIDRDGTLIREPQTDFQVDALDKFSFYPGVFTYLGRIASELDYTLVMVTNQDGLGTSSYPEKNFWPYQELMVQALEGEGIVFEDVFIDRSFEYEGSPYRKPGTAMLGKYLKGHHDLARSFVVGDRWSDIQLAQNLGAQGIYLNEYNGSAGSPPEHLKSSVVLLTSTWKDIYNFLKKQDRITSIRRKTSETNIEVHINLDGKGQSSINTGLHFFDHMLEQIARHGEIDLIVDAKGDLHIDEHHTIEDTAITLGKAVKNALGKKVGIQRYGFVLPMDDSLSQVAIDFGGRPWIVWEASFKRERVGDVPTELFYHFFKSFSDHAECNLNIKIEGDNEHHMIESTFKSFARALRQAKSRDIHSDVLPSTKGTL